MRDYIKARDGYMYTDGKTYGKLIWIAEGINKDSFYEITEEEYNAKMEAEETVL